MIDTLPKNIFPIILCTLSRDEIRNFAKSSKSIHNIINSTSFWRNLLLYRYAIIESKAYEKEYQQKYNDDSMKLFEYIGKNDLVSFNNLLHKGANVNARNEFLDTPLIYAAKCDRTIFVKLLLQIKEVKVNIHLSERQALTFALLNDNQEMIEMLLKAGANPNIGIHVFPRRRYDNALSYAVSKCCIKIVKLLLDAGAKVNCKSNLPPLHAAVEKDDVEIVKLLLDYGADVNLRDVYNEDVISYIRKRSVHKSAIIKLLLEKGLSISPNQLTKLGYWDC